MPSQPVVRVVPFQPHCFAFGGFEVQMITAMETARAAGTDIAPLDPWRREADFDVLHLWGLAVDHIITIQLARAAHKKIVLTALLPYPSLLSRLRHLASLAVGPARLRNSVLKAIDCVTVLNQAQAQYLSNTLGFPAEKISIVPNAVDDIFFETAGEAENSFGIENYVLCTGNICHRKNQLALVEACKKLGVPLLLVGKTLVGEEDYGRAVAEAMERHGNSRWIQWLPPGSSDLAAAYRHAAIFALPSFDETQPISALEAAAGRKSLVLADRPYAKQEFYENALLTDPHSADSIAKALSKALDRPGAYCPPAATLEKCRRQKVGAAYRAIYDTLIQP